ncbi:MAG: nucleotide exchange factor GrpE [Desulfobacterium sp.]|nr:nucleotide exchange factor GrpE [Desulfobacterium sp.]
MKVEIEEDFANLDEIDVTEEEVEKVASEAEQQEDQPDPMLAALEAAKQEAKDNYDRFLRQTAEFENYKKRTAREMSDFRKYANETIIRELLPVVDNLERAIESSGGDEKSDSCVVEGVEMTLKSILKVFDQFQVKQLESMGKPFDPVFHQAVMREESEAYPENTVIRELQKGYLLHERMIRPAMVVVSTAKPDDNKQEKNQYESI